MTTKLGQFNYSAYTSEPQDVLRLIRSTDFYCTNTFICQSFLILTVPLTQFYTVDTGFYFGTLWKFNPHGAGPHSLFQRVSRSSALFTAQRACVCVWFPLSQLWNSSMGARSQGGTRLRSHTDIHLTAEGQFHTSQRTGWGFHTLPSGD